ncbi:MAG: polymer-forming cytoskeletal protein [Chitinivibrionales bacterium]|nr:polymer-forming cytoskeletal protein [Chitinivibrionales bacterium]
MEKGNKGLYTILGEGSHFDGTLSAPHSIRIDGVLKGSIETTETLTVGSLGNIEADIKARRAIIGGKIVGNVIAEERVELETKSSLVGDLKTRNLIINEGALFHGACSMDSPKSNAQ